VKHTFHLSTEAKRPFLVAWAQKCPVGWVVDFKEPGRTLDQNDLIHPLVRCFEQQAELHGRKFNLDQWKAILMKSFGQEIEILPDLNGGFFPNTLKTSKLSKTEASAFIEYIYAEGAKLGVKFNDGEL
jgi:hypothetical protein